MKPILDEASPAQAQRSTPKQATHELEQFDSAWLLALEQTSLARLFAGLVGLTRFGERPAHLEHLAAILDQSVDVTNALLRGNTSARVEGELIHWDDPFPGTRARRTLCVGDRRILMKSGCAPDLFLYAAVVDVPFRVEDTCAVTGTPIRVAFVPNGYEWADPSGAVTALVSIEQLNQCSGASFAQVDATVCTDQPFFASAAAAQGWLEKHPGGRVFTMNEMFERPWLAYYRDTLRPLVGTGKHIPPLRGHSVPG